MKKLYTLLLLTILFIGNSNAQHKSLYDFTVNTLQGEVFPMSELKGKKVLIVNTASKCGKTPQYADLQKLYEEYGGDNFTIIGFPANNFMNQEPGTNEEIATFCEINYGVTFPMMAKISVKGDDIAPIYKWLTTKEENGVLDSDVDWNFHKYLIDEKGQLVSSLKSGVKPYNEEILNWINGE